MGDESKVDVYKRLTLDLLGGSGQWVSYANIYWEHYDADGEVDEAVLRDALSGLVGEGKIARGDTDEYRIAPPQEGERLAEKVKRLEVENAELRAQMSAVNLAKEKVDRAVEYAAAVLRLREENGRLRAEQAADRAAVTALVESLPECWMPDCDRLATRQCCAAGADDIYCDEHGGDFEPDEIGDICHAAPLRALQARMATWEEAK